MKDVTIATLVEGGDAVLRLGGELDLSHVDAIWRCVDSVLGTGPRRLVVDVTDVTFCDSSVLGVFIRAHQVAAGRGTALSIRRPGPTVSRVLNLSGLDQRIVIERDQDDRASSAS